MIICVNAPFGDFNSLYNQIKDSLTHPPIFKKIDVPAIIRTLQEKMFSAVEGAKSYISSINMEVCNLISHLNEMSFFDLVIKGVKKILDVLGISSLLRSIFPKIIGLGISIYDVITGAISPEEIYKAIKKAIKEGLDVLWTFVPKPFFIDLDIPDISAPMIFQMILKQYKDIFLKPLMDLLGSLLDLIEALDLGTFSFSLPKIPTVNEIIKQLYNKIKAFAIAKAIDLKNTVVSSFGEVMALAKKMMGYGMKISELLNGLSFSSLKGWFFSAIDDMFKTVKMMSVELMLQVNHMIDSIYLFAYKLIWDFISSLPLIGDAFKALFSPLCIPIPTLR